MRVIVACISSFLGLIKKRVCNHSWYVNLINSFFLSKISIFLETPWPAGNWLEKLNPFWDGYFYFQRFDKLHKHSFYCFSEVNYRYTRAKRKNKNYIPVLSVYMCRSLSMCTYICMYMYMHVKNVQWNEIEENTRNEPTEREKESERNMSEKKLWEINCDKRQIHCSVTNDFLRYQFVYSFRSLNCCIHLLHNQPETTGETIRTYANAKRITHHLPWERTLH